MSASRLAVSVDVGGTFTDVVALDLSTGQVHVGKRPTLPDAPAESIAEALDALGMALETVDRFVHGTTIGINALLQRRGAAVGFITTRGFRDMLAIAEGRWPSFRLTYERPEPLVSRLRTSEVDERLRADGTVLVPLDEAGLLEAAARLVDGGAEAIALCFVNAYVDPVHERRAAAVLGAAFPLVPVVASTDLSRRFREHARALTVVGEAYLRPVVQRYFDRLERGLHDGGFRGRTLITSSDGGVMSIGLARERALRSLVSGCASGIAGAAVVARSGGWPDIIAIDMGGTSFDAALVRGGEPSMAAVAEVAGQEYLMPMLDLQTIGAGGGSIASVDTVGALDVGPASAGSDPGPACYRRGGTAATFTDAALVAGLLPSALVDGAMTLDADAAYEAVEREVALPLGLDVQQAAAGILSIVEAKMGRLLEEMTVGHGVDPRTFALFAYGGGGPLVAARLAEQLGSRCVVVPPHPGVFSAWGMQTLDMVHEESRTHRVDPEAVQSSELRAPLDEMIEKAVAVLAAQDVPDRSITVVPLVEMRYHEQEHTMVIPFGSGDAAALRQSFEDAHRSAFGFTVEGGVEIIGYRVRAVGALSNPPPGVAPPPGSGSPSGVRTVHDRVGGTDDWLVWRRADLPLDTAVPGPVIVEEPTSTTVVPHGWRATARATGDLVLDR